MIVDKLLGSELHSATSLYRKFHCHDLNLCGGICNLSKFQVFLHVECTQEHAINLLERYSEANPLTHFEMVGKQSLKHSMELIGSQFSSKAIYPPLHSFRQISQEEQCQDTS